MSSSILRRAYIACVCAFLSIGAGAAGIYDTVAISGGASPSGDGVYSTFDRPRLTDSGKVGFSATLSATPHTAGVFLQDRGDFLSQFQQFAAPTLIEVARRGDVSPDLDGVLGSFASLAFSDANSNFGDPPPQYAFVTTFEGSASTGGIITGDGFNEYVVLRTGQIDPYGNAYTSFSSPAVAGTGCCVGVGFAATSVDTVPNSLGVSAVDSSAVGYEGAGFSATFGSFSGTFGEIGRPSIASDGFSNVRYVAFAAGISNPFPDNGESAGVFVNEYFGSGLVAIDTNAASPAKVFSDPVVNRGGQLAYKTTDLSSGSHEVIVHASAEGGLGFAAQTGDGSPDGNGLFASFSNPALSEGHIAFHAGLSGTAAGALDDQGIFRMQLYVSSTEAVVRTNQLVPGTSVTFEDLQNPVVNGGGQVLFGAQIGNGFGGQIEGLFLSDGDDFVTIAKQGDALAGSFVVGLDYLDLPDPGGHQALNDFGQVAYRANLLDGRQAIQLFTPDLEFEGTGTASWIDPANWTLGLIPQAPHTAYIRPDSGHLVVELPAGIGGEYFLKKLVVAPTGGATVDLLLASPLDGIPSLSSHFTAFVEELSIGAGAAVKVGSAPGETVVSLYTESVTLAGGHFGRTTPDASGFIYINQISGFGAAEASYFCCLGTFENRNRIDAFGGTLDLELTYAGISRAEITVDASSVLNLNSLDGASFGFYETTFDLEGGTINIPKDVLTDEGTLVTGHGTLHARFRGGVDSSIDATGGLLAVGSATALNGFATDGDIAVRTGGILELRSRVTPASIGRDTLMDGGQLDSETGIYLAGGRLLHGHGIVTGAVQSALGSTILAEGDLALGDSGALNGYFSDGLLAVERHIVTLHDRNEAVLGALTTIGDNLGGGVLDAPNGIVLEFGKAVSGHGDIFGDLLNNGFIEGVGPDLADALELHGLVTGVGDYGGTIIFSGTFSPGLSPTEVMLENFVSETETIIELAGEVQGEEYDYINASGTAILGGTLVIDLLDGFAPEAGDVFTFLTALGGISGTFDEVWLPQIAGLSFGLVYEPLSLSLVSATAVPLPGAVWLLLSGLALVLRRQAVRA